MNHKELVDEVCDWLYTQFPYSIIEKEKAFRINLERPGLKKPFFRIDAIVTENTGEKIGIECKTLKDWIRFRDLMAAIGQTWILQKVFGRSYLALEVVENMLPNKDAFKFYKLLSAVENAHHELGFGVLLVGNNVYCVRRPKKTTPDAKSLFVPLGK